MEPAAQNDLGAAPGSCPVHNSPLTAGTKMRQARGTKMGQARVVGAKAEDLEGNQDGGTNTGQANAEGVHPEKLGVPVSAEITG